MKTALAFFISVLATIINTVAIFFMWRWFIEPFEAPAISIVHAYGLGLCTNFFKKSSISDSNEDKMLDRSIFNLVLPVFILFFGYLAHLFM